VLCGVEEGACVDAFDVATCVSRCALTLPSVCHVANVCQVPVYRL
jgi:hypothetical protein